MGVAFLVCIALMIRGTCAPESSARIFAGLFLAESLNV